MDTTIELVYVVKAWVPLYNDTPEVIAAARAAAAEAEVEVHASIPLGDGRHSMSPRVETAALLTTDALDALPSYLGHVAEGEDGGIDELREVGLIAGPASN